jgi:O-antigen ligase
VVHILQREHRCTSIAADRTDSRPGIVRPSSAIHESVHAVGRLDYLLVGAPLISTSILAFDHGGFASTTWGWSACFLLVLAVVAALKGRIRFRSPALWFVTGLTLLSAGMLASYWWALAPGAAVLDSQRVLVYVGLASCAVAAADRRAWRWLATGAAAVAVLVCADAITTRLVPQVGSSAYDPLARYALGHFRLYEPIGYWNALGILAGMGLVIAVGIATTARGPARFVAAGSLPMSSLVLYLTFSRGAMLSTAIGLAVTVVCARDSRAVLRTITAQAPVAATLVGIASRVPSITSAHPTSGGALRSNAVLFGMVIAMIAAAWVAKPRPSRSRHTRRGMIGFGAVAALIAVAVLVAGSGSHGSGGRSAAGAQRLNAHLYTVSDSGRFGLWRVALDGLATHPVTGIGSGSYVRYWDQHRSTNLNVQEAHNLYLETLAELGPAGLVLLVATLSLPLLAVRGHRPQTPLRASLIGAYLAFLVHAGFDWDWDVPAVGGVAVLIGCALILVGRRTAPTPPRNRRLGIAGLFATLAVAAAFGYVGNSVAARSADALAAGDWSGAAAAASSAMTWQPWSTQGLLDRGQAEQHMGTPAGLRVAAANYRAGIQRDAGDWELWLGLAEVTSGSGQNDALMHARALNPRGKQIELFVRLLGSHANGSGHWAAYHAQLLPSES